MPWQLKLFTGSYIHLNTNSMEMHSSLRNRLTNREEIALAIAKPRGALADASS